MKTRPMMATLFALIALLGTVLTSHAGSMNANEEGVLVPYAIFDNTGVDTLIRLRTRTAGRVYWAFFDTNGNRLVNDSITMQTDDTYGFIWSEEADNAGTIDLANEEGFLIFGFDSDGNGQIDSFDDDTLSANALIRDTTFGNQLLYLPVLALEGDSLVSDPQSWNTNPTPQLNPTLSQFKVAQSFSLVEWQYSEESDPNGLQSKLIIWSSLDLGGNQPMILISEEGSTKNIQVLLRNNNLNILEPSELDGFTDTYLGNGFLRWQVPLSNGQNTWVFAFSTVSSVDAVLSQSLMATFGF